MSIDFSAYSIEDLQSFLPAIEKEIEQKKNAKRKSLMGDLERLAREAGVDLRDLLADAKATKPAKTRAPVSAKYRNPDRPADTWSGRGRQPLWLAAKLAEGKKLEDFAI